MIDSLMEVELRERALRLEARKASLDALVRVHLESVGGTRQLVLGHLRLLFTLSLGMLAGVITLFAAALRLGGADLLPLPPHTAMLALVSLITMTTSALLSAATLQRATQQASRFLREPFPNAAGELSRLFAPETRDETAILTGVLDVLDRRVQAETLVQPRTALSSVLLLLGIVAMAIAFAL